MGHVHKPIPPEVLMLMPPDVRWRIAEEERALLVALHKAQRQTPIVNLWIVVLAVLAISYWFAR